MGSTALKLGASPPRMDVQAIYESGFDLPRIVTLQGGLPPPPKPSPPPVPTVPVEVMEIPEAVKDRLCAAVVAMAEFTHRLEWEEKTWVAWHRALQEFDDAEAAVLSAASRKRTYRKRDGFGTPLAGRVPTTSVEAIQSRADWWVSLSRVEQRVLTLWSVGVEPGPLSRELSLKTPVVKSIIAKHGHRMVKHG